jgi:transposase-like protein
MCDRMYSEEFKQNALELAETTEKSDAQIERDLGMSAGWTSTRRLKSHIS